MRPSVGLVVFTRLDYEDKANVAAVVLQRRGMFNMEKKGAESWPFCCQVTAHGKLEESETFEEALLREVREELGEKFAELFRPQAPRALVLTHEVTEKKEVMTFGIGMDFEHVRTIRLAPDSGGLDIVRVDEIEKPNSLIEITPEIKMTGCPPSIRALFQDEIKAVQRGCEIIKLAVGL